MSSQPIGVFDSGIGGLSILAALLDALPHEAFVYYSDASHAPYGERDDAFIAERSQSITETLRQQHDIKALVVACNTATNVAIHLLRAQHAPLPIVGVEPAIKPALEAHPHGRVAVLATDRTLGSDKYRALIARMQQAYPDAQMAHIACSGLAGAIEAGDDATIDALCQRYTREALALGAHTLVLGCTHYPLVLERLQQHAPDAQFIHSAPAVARQTRQRLQEAGMLAAEHSEAKEGQGGLPRLRLMGSGDGASLHEKAGHHLARCGVVFDAA